MRKKCNEQAQLFFPLKVQVRPHTSLNAIHPTLLNPRSASEPPLPAPHRAERDVSLAAAIAAAGECIESRFMEMFNFSPARQPGALCPFSNLINQNASFSRFVSLAFICCGSTPLVQTASPRRTSPYRGRASESWRYWYDKSSFSAGFAGGIFRTDDA